MRVNQAKGRTFSEASRSANRDTGPLTANNFKEQAVVYASLVLFLGWLWGSVLASLGAVFATIAIAHTLCFLSRERDPPETGPVKRTPSEIGPVERAPPETAPVFEDDEDSPSDLLKAQEFLKDL